MAPPKLTPAQVRDRRAKIAAVVLSVVFVAALAIQGPKLLKMIHKSSPPVSASTIDVAPIGGTTTAPATPVGSGSALPVAATTTVSSQLTGLGRFAWKDPFYAQNVTTTTASSGSTPPASTTTAATTTAATTTAATTTTASTTPSTPKLPTGTKTKTPAATTTTPALSVPFTLAPAAPPNAAVLLTNGKREVIPVGQDFPTDAPLFKLTAVRAHGKHVSIIRVAVLGGSFANGVQSVPIQMGKTITFKDESDGTSYVVKVLRLTTVTTPVDGSGTPASTTTASTTPPPAGQPPAGTTSTASTQSTKG